MKKRSGLVLFLLSAAVAVHSAPAQTILQNVRVMLTTSNAIPGLVDGDQFDIRFGLNFGAIDGLDDLANFQNSGDIVAPGSISISRVAGNAGTWDPGSMTFSLTHLLGSNTPSYDYLSFVFESYSANTPAPGYTLDLVELDFMTFTNLGLIQDSPAVGSPLASFLGGPAINYSGFEQAYGFFDMAVGASISFNVVSASAVAVPEPSTYAALAGMAALGLAVWRRRVMPRRA